MKNLDFLHCFDEGFERVFEEIKEEFDKIPLV